MKKYIKSLEDQNDKMKEKLASADVKIELLENMVKNRMSFSLCIFMRVNGHLIGIEWLSGVRYTSALAACIHLRRFWDRYKKDFKKRFEPDGFEFKYFSIDGSFIVDDAQKRNEECFGLGPDWSFETKEDLNKTIKELKALKV